MSAAFGFFVLGMVLLVIGADRFVRGAANLAALLGLSPLVIGLTVVAFGTSAPEIGVSVNAALNGQSDLAVGNVIGSDLFNILIILGISAIIVPLAVSKRLLYFDVPLMIASASLLWLLGLDGGVHFWDGVLLTLLLVAWVALTFRHGDADSSEAEEFLNDQFKARRDVPFLVGGLFALIVGSKLSVMGAVNLATHFGVSEAVIGLTIVAAGTSLPEAATSIVAAIKGERELAVGNIIGSNLFNVLCVVGVSAMISDPLVVTDGMLQRDLPLHLLISILCWPVFFTQLRVSRSEGGLFVFIYLAYIALLLIELLRPELIAASMTTIIWLGWIPAVAVAAILMMLVHFYRYGFRTGG